MTLSIQSPSTILESRSYKCYTIRLTVYRHVCRGSFQNCPDSQCRITDTWYVLQDNLGPALQVLLLIILFLYLSLSYSFVLSIISFFLVKFGSNFTHTMSMGSDLDIVILAVYIVYTCRFIEIPLIVYAIFIFIEKKHTW